VAPEFVVLSRVLIIFSALMGLVVIGLESMLFGCITVL